MKKRDTRGKTAYIKKVDWSLANGVPSTESLESLLIKAMAIADDQREFTPNEGSAIRRGLVKGQASAAGISWVFVTFEIGKSVEMVSTDNKTGSRDLVAAPVTQVEGANRQKLEGAAYFSVKGDTLAISQSVALSIEALEAHLNWLLGDKLKIVKSGYLMLVDDPPGNIRDQILTHGVTQVNLGVPLSALVKGADGNDGVLRLVEGFFTRRLKDNWLSTLGSGFKAANVSGITTKIEIKASAKAGEEAQRLMNGIALGMRHNLDGVSFWLGNGEEIKASSLIHRRKFRVEFFDGVPSLTEMYSYLKAMLSDDGEQDGE